MIIGRNELAKWYKRNTTNIKVDNRRQASKKKNRGGMASFEDFGKDIEEIGEEVAEEEPLIVRYP